MYDPRLHFHFKELLAYYHEKSPEVDFTFFSQRAFSNLARIKELFVRLYGQREDAEEQFWFLIQDLFGSFEARGEDLRLLDLQREQKADWLASEKWVGMMLYVDRFAGKIKDVGERIDYFKELGINWVHLMPLLKSPEGSNDGGYAVSDYEDVDPRFGELEDLKELSQKLRQEGILLTLDLVMNHTSDEHEWAQKALAGDKFYQDYYYFYDDRGLPDEFEKGMPEVFPHSSPGNFTYVEDLQKWVMSVFHSYQWDLNYTNPGVFREMIKVLLYLGNLGVDIIRLDAVAFTWKIPGTSSQNTEEAHIILQLMKACAQVVSPGLAFIAEAIVAPQEVIKYFGEGVNRGQECEIAYNATFMALLWDALATQETTLLNMGVKGIPAKPESCTWINYVRCHDDIGLGFDDQHMYQLGKHPFSHKRFLIDYYSGNFEGSMASGAPFASNPKTGDARISGSLASLAGLEMAMKMGDSDKIDEAIKKVLMLHNIILTYGGLPLLYYGDEVGTPNDHSYLENPDLSYDNRWMHRPVIDWSKVDRRKIPGTVERTLFTALKRLIFLRKASPEMADLNTTSIEESGNSHVFSYLKWHKGGAKSFMLSNFSSETQLVRLDALWRCGFNAFEVLDKVSGQTPEFRDEWLVLQPYEFLWLTEPSTFEAFQQAEEITHLRKEGLWPAKVDRLSEWLQPNQVAS
ncbi:MAG: alpha-amylase family protein [Bacteroidota bacterium]